MQTDRCICVNCERIDSLFTYTSSAPKKTQGSVQSGDSNTSYLSCYTPSPLYLLSPPIPPSLPQQPLCSSDFRPRSLSLSLLSLGSLCLSPDTRSRSTWRNSLPLRRQMRVEAAGPSPSLFLSDCGGWEERQLLLLPVPMQCWSEIVLPKHLILALRKTNSLPEALLSSSPLISQWRNQAWKKLLYKSLWRQPCILCGYGSFSCL